MFLKLLVQEPVESEVELRPYLGLDERTDEEKEVTTRELRWKNHNRIEKKQLLHWWKLVPLWERIYKYHPEALASHHIRVPPRRLIMFEPYPKYFTK